PRAAGGKLLGSFARRHVHLDERSIGNLVLERDTIAQPSESGDKTLGEVLLRGRAFLNLAVNAVARPRLPDELPGDVRAERLYLIVAEPDNRAVGYRF